MDIPLNGHVGESGEWDWESQSIYVNVGSMSQSSLEDCDGPFIAANSY